MTSHRFDGFTKLDSAHLDGVKYNAADRKMTVRFSNGYQYIVHGVPPEEHKAFLEASSHGEHYHKFIRDRYHVERIR